MLPPGLEFSPLLFSFPSSACSCLQASPCFPPNRALSEVTQQQRSHESKTKPPTTQFRMQCCADRASNRCSVAVVVVGLLLRRRHGATCCRFFSPLRPRPRRVPSPSSVGSESTVVSSDEIAAANAVGEGTGGGGGGSAEAAVWAATAEATDPRVRFYVSMTLKHRWPVMWSDIIMDRVAKGGYEVSQQKLDNMVRRKREGREERKKKI